MKRLYFILLLVLIGWTNVPIDLKPVLLHSEYGIDLLALAGKANEAVFSMTYDSHFEGLVQTYKIVHSHPSIRNNRERNEQPAINSSVFTASLKQKFLVVGQMFRKYLVKRDLTSLIRQLRI